MDESIATALDTNPPGRNHERDTDAQILVVDDERDLADLYATWLGERYQTKPVYSGDAAIDCLGQECDVLLLDRKMPGISGDDVLDAISEHDLDVKVAVLTGLRPDLDVIEMGFDTYLVKPVTKGELIDVVDKLLTIANVEQRFQELYALVQKRAALETHVNTAELESNDGYAALEARISHLRAESQETLGEPAEGIASLMPSVSRSPTETH